MAFDNNIEIEKIELVSHRKEWSHEFMREKLLLSKVFNGYLRHIEHIGSTAVEDIDTKPIIDIGVLIDSIDNIPKIIEPLFKIQYSYQGEYGLPGRHFFIKGRPREFHLHIVDNSTDHWKNWLVFREILKRDKDIRRRYQDLKYKLLEKYQFDREKYTNGKSDFINSILNEEFKRA